MYTPETTTTEVEDVLYRDIPGFPNYRIGSDGSVWTRYTRGTGGWTVGEWKKNKQTIDKGYCRVRMKASNGKRYSKRVHRLLLEVFVGPCPAGMEACHGPDQNKSNNSLSNLRWGTHQENSQEAVDAGLWPIGSRSRSAKLSEDDIPNIFVLLMEGWTHREIGDMYGVDHSQITRINTGQRWKHVKKTIEECR